VAARGEVAVFELAGDVPVVALAEVAPGGELVVDGVAGTFVAGELVVAVAAVEVGLEADAGDDEVQVLGREGHGLMLARLGHP
jgi:hypothetical protein